MSTFRERLRYYRKLAGYKRANEFSEAIGVPYTTYLSYENAGKEPRYETLVRIANKLGITTDELLGHTPTIMYSDRIPKEVLNTILRKAEEVKRQYIKNCLEMYLQYPKKVRE